MERKLQQGISLFVRDEQTGRFILNAKALQALGINPVEAQQRGIVCHSNCPRPSLIWSHFRPYLRIQRQPGPG